MVTRLGHTPVVFPWFRPLLPGFSNSRCQRPVVTCLVNLGCHPVVMLLGYPWLRRPEAPPSAWNIGVCDTSLFLQRLRGYGGGSVVVRGSLCVWVTWVWA